MAWEGPRGMSGIFFQGTALFYDVTRVTVTDVETVIVAAAHDTIITYIALVSGDPVDIGEFGVTFGTGWPLVNAGDQTPPNNTQRAISGICDTAKSGVVVVYRFKAQQNP